VGVLLQQFAEDFREAGWQEVFGSSGSAKAVDAVVQAMGLTDDGVTLEALAELREAVLEQGQMDLLRLPGLTEERAPVFAGAVVIFEAAFEALGNYHMRVCESSMR
jgi:exopolyphosphatase/guanosine-5'-triphosphate,3'-diphosphate pyrophosphatase